MRSMLAVCLIGASANDALLDEGLSLLQLRAVAKDGEAEADEELTQSPFKRQTTPCAPNEELSLDQCMEVWKSAEFSKDIRSGSPGNRYMKGPMTHSDGNGPNGCFVWQNQAYWSPGRKDGRTRANPNRPSICAADGGGDRINEPGVNEPMPAEAVEMQPVNTQCECGILSFDQCGTWMQINRPPYASHHQFGSSMGEGLPFIQTNFLAELNNPNQFGIGGSGPRGCFAVEKQGGFEMYYNPDDADEPVSDHPRRRPICPVCPKTTTTEAPPAVDPVEPDNGDEAAAEADPHLRTNTGVHFDLE